MITGRVNEFIKRLKRASGHVAKAGRIMLRGHSAIGHEGRIIIDDVLHPPTPSDHPSNLCKCPHRGPPSSLAYFDHEPDCEWAKRMCRMCSGDGTCSNCRGDGVDPDQETERQAVEEARLAGMRRLTSVPTSPVVGDPGETVWPDPGLEGWTCKLCEALNTGEKTMCWRCWFARPDR